MDRTPPGFHRTNTQRLTFESTYALCRVFEKQNDMSSADFYDLYRKGEWVGTQAGFAASVWASHWETYLDLRPEPQPSFHIVHAPLRSPSDDLVSA